MTCFHSISFPGRVVVFLAVFMLAGATSGQCEPETLGVVDIRVSIHAGVAVSGAVAYVAVAESGVFAIDVSDPANPTILGSVDTPGNEWDVAVSGTVAYVASSSGLQVIDVSDPSSPVIVGSLLSADGRAIAVSGTLAYIPAFPNLTVIDVSDPENPVMLGSVEFAWSITDVAVSGVVAYVLVNRPGGGDAGLRIVDVSDPANPEVIGSFEQDLDHATGLAVSGTLAYVVADRGLYLLDVSDPENPAIIGSISAGLRYPEHVAVSGTVAYMSGGLPVDVFSSMHVIDVSDPADPTILALIERPGNLGAAVAVAGTIAYMVEGDRDRDGHMVTFEMVTCRHGACCINDGCLDGLDGVQCAAVGGAYLGHDTECSSDDCLPACATDLDHSGAVDFGDILRVLSDWGPCPP